MEVSVIVSFPQEAFHIERIVPITSSESGLIMSNLQTDLIISAEK